MRNVVKTPHEALHRIFRDDSDLSTRAVQRLLGIEFPTPQRISVLDSDLTNIEPVERRVDTILYIETSTTDHILIIESQTGKSEDKRRSWPYYIAHLHTKYQVPVTLLVISADQATVTWARTPIHIGLHDHPSLTCRPLVLGPDNVPAIANIDQATDDVMLAVFSALTHKNSADVEQILSTLATALDTIDPLSAAYLAEFTEVGLAQTAALQIWRSLMSTMAYPYQSHLRSQGREEGRAEGRAEGEARAVLRVLDRRNVRVPPDVRERIMACTDTTTLETWLDRALTATTIDDLLA